MNKLFLMFIVSLLNMTFAQAANGLKCVVGNPNNQVLSNAYKNTQNDPFTSFYLQNQIKAPEECTTTLPNPSVITPLVEFKKQLYQTYGPGKIQKKCIHAALKRGSGVKGYVCNSPKGKAISTGSTDENGPCITEPIVDYLHWTINQAIDCVSPEDGVPLDARIIFKKLNTETGFHFNMANEGAIGIGQITSIAVEELQINPESKKIFKEILTSSKSSCLPFKDLLKKKLHTPLRKCEHVNLGSGMATNMLYSLILYRHMRDSHVYGAKSHLQKKHITDPQIINYLTFSMYGPKGLSARDLVNSNKIPSDISYSDFKKALSHKDIYLRQADHKMEEVLKLMNPAKNTFLESEINGDTCLED